MAETAPVLTHRQEQLVDAVVLGGHKSLAQAAKSVEMTRGNASRMRAVESVSTAIAVRKQEGLDKARSGAAALRSAGQMILKRAEEFLKDKELAVVELLALHKLQLERTKDAELLGITVDDGADRLTRSRKRDLALIRFGSWLGAGRKPFGFAPKSKPPKT